MGPSWRLTTSVVKLRILSPRIRQGSKSLPLQFNMVLEVLVSAIR
jgi:hypothetical protein